MSIIRAPHYQLNDTMRDVIGELTEREVLTGLERVGIFESFLSMSFDRQPVCTLGILPEDVYAIASEVTDASVGTATFYVRKHVGTPNQTIQRMVRLTLPESSLAKLSLTVALVLYMERGFFIGETADEEREKIVAWTAKHWEGYESIATDVLEILGKVLIAKKKDDGGLVDPFNHGAFKVD